MRTSLQRMGNGEHSVFTAGRYGHYAGYAEDDILYVAAERCSFKTGNRQTLQKLAAGVPKGNSVYFIHQSGKEERVRPLSLFARIMKKLITGGNGIEPEEN